MPVLTLARKCFLPVMTGLVLATVVAIIVFFILWEIGSRSKDWLGYALPWVSQIPAPTAVFREMYILVQEPSFWHSAYLSTFRVMEGFLFRRIGRRRRETKVRCLV